MFWDKVAQSSMDVVATAIAVTLAVPLMAIIAAPILETFWF